jgi:mannose-6-phosphate isomerase-like protein (cupin superfamily)
MPYEVEKPWGIEHILEVNDNYAVKELRMKAGHQCSLQSHRFKRETFYMVSGEMSFIVENADGEMAAIAIKPGQSFTIKPGVKHRMRAITDIVYLECSTPHLDDVVRFDDDYSRTLNN